MLKRALWLVAVLVLLSCQDGQESSDNQQQPNVLVILVDDLRPDLGSYGHSIVRSPGIDQLARRGMRFDRAYAQAPVCNPSRASLLTGLRPNTTGVLNNRHSLVKKLPGALTLPGLFQRENYFTASLGKIFHGTGRQGSWTDAESWDLEFGPGYAGYQGRVLEMGSVGRYRWRATRGRDQRFVDARTTQKVIAVLEERRDQPFFMMVGLTATHPPFEAPARFFELYPVETIPLPAAMPSANRRSYATLAWSDQEEGRFTDQQQRELIRAYWACVSSVDEQVGKILATLDRLNLTDSTIVVLTSDHGYHLGEHDWWSKHTLFEVATRVPLIVSTPDMQSRGTSSQRLVELVDLYPTLADLAGLEEPATLEGRSMVPLLHDPDQPWKRAAYSQLLVGAVEGTSVRTDRWRYTEWKKGRRGVELYDHDVDPQEIHNLAGERDHRRIQRQLRRLVRRSF